MHGQFPSMAPLLQDERFVFLQQQRFVELLLLHTFMVCTRVQL